MMEDLISRQAAIDALEESKKTYFDRKVIIGKMQDIVNNLPSAQPERKMGKWMHDKDDILYSGYCSYCGWMAVIMETDVADMPFCPNCGADMMKGAEENEM